MSFSVFIKIMIRGSSKSPTLALIPIFGEDLRLNLYLDAGNRPRHHRHRSPGHHRIVAPNRCNDCRLNSVPCRRRDTCSRTVLARILPPPCRRCPIPPVLPQAVISYGSSPSRNAARDVASRWCTQNLLFRLSAWFQCRRLRYAIFTRVLMKSAN